MTVSKVTCPECSTVLRPAKPLAAGKKIKCPKCETVFTVGADEEEDAPPRKAATEKKPSKAGAVKQSGGKSASKPPAKEEAAKPKDEEEIGVYNVFKDEDDEDHGKDEGKGKGRKKGGEKVEKKKKPQIEYAPDMSIKDLRGPAVAIVMSSSNKLTLVGFLGFFGWLVLIVLLIIPAVFPIKGEKEGVVLQFGAGLGSASPTGGFGIPGGTRASSDGPKPGEEKAGFFEVGGYDISRLCELDWYVFFPSLLPLVVMMACSGVVGYGAIQMQNLESRGWGFAACVMAWLPLSCGGLQLVTIMVVQFFLGMVIDDTDFNTIVGVVVASAEWIASIAIGVWAFVTLKNKDVIAGFEYVAE